MRGRPEGLAQNRSDFPVDAPCERCCFATTNTAAATLSCEPSIWDGRHGRLAPQSKGDKPRVSAGNGTLIIGSYPKQFWIIDEATEKVVGTIPFKSGIPRRTTISRDRKRFYTIEAGMEKIEILDIAARKTIDSFTLSEGNKKVRIRSIEPDPLHRFVVMVTASATKLIDRFEIGAPTLVQYDLKDHKIVRTIPWPKDEERQNANILFSPDGKLMYLFSDQDVLIYETNRSRKSTNGSCRGRSRKASDVSSSDRAIS